MNKTIITVLSAILALVLVVSIAWSIWNIKRIVHYKLSYESMVENTVRSMVKPEALKDRK